MVQEVFLGERLRWPEPIRCAVALVFNFQGAEGLEPGPNGRIEYEVYTKREFGPRSGIWRILRVLREQQVRATFMVCGAIAERYPDAVKAIHAEGHEIAGHGYHHETAWKLTRQEEWDVQGRTIDMLRATTGVTIRGWRTCTQSENTPELLLERGMLWNSNTFSHDFPYLLRQEDRVLVELPRQPFGDGHLYGAHDNGSPNIALDTWRRAFDAYYAESADFPTFAPYSFHPYISGRAGRAQAIGELLRHIKSHEGVWIATGSEIAEAVLASAGELARVPVAA